MKFEFTKGSELELLDTMYGFYLGSLESQMLEQMATHYNVNANKLFAIWNDVAKTPEKCFKFILKNRYNADQISNYLCLINWLSYIYGQMLTTSFKPTLAKFQLDFPEMIEYLEYCFEWYKFNYCYLMEEFRKETRIPNNVKEQVYILND